MYHTSVLLGGRELTFNSAGIIASPWTRSHAQLGAGMAPRFLDLGYSGLLRDALDGGALEARLFELLGDEFRAGEYDPVHKNCNAFSDCALFVLLGTRLDPAFAELRVGSTAYSALSARLPSATFDLERFIESLEPGWKAVAPLAPAQASSAREFTSAASASSRRQLQPFPAARASATERRKAPPLPAVPQRERSMMATNKVAAPAEDEDPDDLSDEEREAVYEQEEVPQRLIAPSSHCSSSRYEALRSAPNAGTSRAANGESFGRSGSGGHKKHSKVGAELFLNEQEVAMNKALGGEQATEHDENEEPRRCLEVCEASSSATKRRSRGGEGGPRRGGKGGDGEGGVDENELQTPMPTKAAEKEVVKINRHLTSHSTCPSTPMNLAGGRGRLADDDLPPRSLGFGDQQFDSLDLQPGGGGDCGEPSVGESSLSPPTQTLPADSPRSTLSSSPVSQLLPPEGTQDLSPSTGADDGIEPSMGAASDAAAQVAAEPTPPPTSGSDTAGGSGGGSRRRRSQEAEAEDERLAWLIQQQMDDEMRQEQAALLRGAGGGGTSGRRRRGRGSSGGGDASASAPGAEGGEPGSASSSSPGSRGFWTTIFEHCHRLRRACACDRPPIVEEPEEIERASGIDVVASPEEAFDVYTTVFTHDGTEDHSAAGTCGVCLDTYLAGEEVRSLPCAHQFHRECIDRWLLKKAVCPTCKTSISVSTA